MGLVLSGIIRSGVASVNKQCLLGPDMTKNFKHVMIKSIHVNRASCEEAYAEELVCLCVKAVKANEKLIRKDIRRGMVVVDCDNKPQPVSEFEAELQILHHSTTIKVNYEGVLHCGTVQQTTTIEDIQNE